MVNGKTREDHRSIMDAMIKLFAAYRDTLEKKSMGFQIERLGPQAAQVWRIVRTSDDGPFGEHSPRKGSGPVLGYPC
jgi:hypothetical protein